MKSSSRQSWGGRSPAESSSWRKPHPYAVVVLVLLGVCTVVSLAAGKGARLPAVALGSELLLDLERAIALFAGALLLLVVLTEAWRGNLPTEISGRGVKYESFKKETQESLEALSEAIAEDRTARKSKQASP